MLNYINISSHAAICNPLADKRIISPEEFEWELKTPADYTILYFRTEAFSMELLDYAY